MPSPASLDWLVDGQHATVMNKKVIGRQVEEVGKRATREEMK